MQLYVCCGRMKDGSGRAGEDGMLEELCDL